MHISRLKLEATEVVSGFLLPLKIYLQRVHQV